MPPSASQRPIIDSAPSNKNSLPTFPPRWMTSFARTCRSPPPWLSLPIIGRFPTSYLPISPPIPPFCPLIVVATCVGDLPSACRGGADPTDRLLSSSSFFASFINCPGGPGIAGGGGSGRPADGIACGDAEELTGGCAGGGGG